MEPLVDNENGLTYKLGTASFEYYVFLLKIIADYQKEIGRRVLIDLRHRSQIVSRHLSYGRSANDPKELLSDVLRAYTLRVESEKDISLSRLRTYAMSLEFTFMYKQNMVVTLIISMKSVILTKSKKTTNLPKSLTKKGHWQSGHYKKPEKPHKHWVFRIFAKITCPVRIKIGFWHLLGEDEFLSKPKRLKTCINTGFLAHFRVIGFRNPEPAHQSPSVG